MIALIQRVRSASVDVDGKRISETGPGLLALVCAQKGDTKEEAAKLAARCAAYRLFPDEKGRMNLDIRQAGGEILAVSQFTLATDTSRGLRPGFDAAEKPEKAKGLFEIFVSEVASIGVPVKMGAFGEEMQVSLVNDGPVTFWVEIPPKTTN